jgi:hypothetical protein
VATAVANNKITNKTAEEYFKDQENMKLDKIKPVTSVDNLLIIRLSFKAVATCYCLLKICFMPSHNVKTLFPRYKLRDWTRKSKKLKFNHLNMNKEMEPMRHLNDIES